MDKNLTFLLAISSCLFTIVNADGLIVETFDGKILGEMSSSPKGRNVFRFEGIPFAVPPLGVLRFADPQPVGKWDGVKDCRHKNIVCMQSRQFFSKYETEDCLVLNVYTPELPSSPKTTYMPVMVYFYGGAFYIGNSTFDAYGPDFLIEHDVVVITVNYRLGAFGFLSTGDTVVPGNFGLKDQQLALKWVNKNIKAFNGDPEKVTIFGNSAGAASVGFQTLNDNNNGLFRAAILASGSPLSTWSLQRNPKKVALQTVKEIDDTATVTSSIEIVQFLRTKSAFKIRDASLRVLNSDPYELDQFANGYYYAPVNDSYDPKGFSTKFTYESLAEGQFSRVPLMIGFTSEETLFLAEDSRFLKNLMRKFDSNPAILTTDNFNIKDENEKMTVGKLLQKLYVGTEGKLEDNLPRGLRYTSDHAINLGALKHAYLASNFTDVFLYQFSYDGQIGNFTTKLEGAGTVTHTEDMNYVWRRNIPTACNVNLGDFPAGDVLTLNRLLKLYTNFAKYLNPTPNKTDPTLQNIEWKSLNIKERMYLDINNNLELKKNLKDDTYLGYDDIFQQKAVKPYTSF